MIKDPPIPFFSSVYAVHVPVGGDSVVLIAPDPLSGSIGRHSVIRIDRKTGKATCIGRELELRLARRVARDGKPLP